MLALAGAIAGKLIEMAGGGDLRAIPQIADSLDGKCAQVIERGDVSVEALSDRELFAIIRGGSCEPVDKPGYPRIVGPKSRSRATQTALALETNLGIGRNSSRMFPIGHLIYMAERVSVALARQHVDIA